jgi:hypothetical protein
VQTGWHTEAEEKVMKESLQFNEAGKFFVSLTIFYLLLIMP